MDVAVGEVHDRQGVGGAVPGEVVPGVAGVGDQAVPDDGDLAAAGELDEDVRLEVLTRVGELTVVEDDHAASLAVDELTVLAGDEVLVERVVGNARARDGVGARAGALHQVVALAQVDVAGGVVEGHGAPEEAHARVEDHAVRAVVDVGAVREVLEGATAGAEGRPGRAASGPGPSEARIEGNARAAARVLRPEGASGGAVPGRDAVGMGRTDVVAGKDGPARDVEAGEAPERGSGGLDAKGRLGDRGAEGVRDPADADVQGVRGVVEPGEVQVGAVPGHGGRVGPDELGVRAVGGGVHVDGRDEAEGELAEGRRGQGGRGEHEGKSAHGDAWR